MRVLLASLVSLLLSAGVAAPVVLAQANPEPRPDGDLLLADDFDYFDFIHTVLPTALPLESFYQEYLGLYRRAVPFSKQLALLRRFPVGELPSVLRRSNAFFKRLGTAHLDYTPTDPAPRPAQKL